jgi:hypothetical protein
VAGIEDHGCRRARRGQPGRDLDTAAARHADVEQRHVGALPLDQAQGLLAVAGAADQLDVLLALDEADDRIDDRRVIVRDDAAQRRGRRVEDVPVPPRPDGVAHVPGWCSGSGPGRARK